MPRIDLWLCLWLTGVTLSIQVPSSSIVPMREAYAELPGVRLWYRDSGGTGVPVVFMHAATGSSILAGDSKSLPAHFYPEALAAFKAALGDFRDIFETLRD